MPVTMEWKAERQGVSLLPCARRQVPYVTDIVGIPDPITGQVSATPLYLFCGSMMLGVSFYGGLFSVLPAYIADLFGQRHAGAIHGRVSRHMLRRHPDGGT